MILTSERLATWPLRAGVLLLAGLPVGIYLAQAAGGLAEGGRGASDAIFTWRLLGTSVGLAAAVAGISAAAGGLAGIVAGRLSRRGAATMLVVFVLPLAVPPSVHAYLWRNFAMEAGLLSGLFVEGGSKAVNFAGALVSLVCAFWTLPALAAFAVASGPGRRYEMEARPFVPASVAARKVLVPAAAPAVAVAAGLVFVLAFADFASGALWQVVTYPVHVMAIYSSFFEPSRAAAASLVPAGITALVAGLAYLLGARAATTMDVERVASGEEALWRPGWALKCLVGLFVAVLLAFPVGFAIVLAAGQVPAAGEVMPIYAELGWTTLLAAGAAVVGTALAVAATAAHWPAAKKWRTALVLVAFAAFLAPPVGVALGVKRIASLHAVPVEFGTTSAAYVFALAGKFLAVPLALAAAVLGRLDADYGRMVRSTGARGVRRMAAVAPAAVPAAVAAFAVALVLGVGELPMGLMLAAPGSPPVSVDLFNLMHYARQGDAILVALSMMAGAAAALVAALAVTRRLWKRYLPTVS